MKKKVSKFLALPGVMLLSAVFAPMAFATASNPIDAGLGKAGVKTSELDSDGLFLDLEAGLLLIVGIAALWTIACIIFSAMKLSSSGGNPQKRNEGIIGLAFAGLGGWAIYNAYDIYGWFSGIGSSKPAAGGTGTILFDITKFF